jgi:hypothetical protein
MNPLKVNTPSPKAMACFMRPEAAENKGSTSVLQSDIMPPRLEGGVSVRHKMNGIKILS